MAAYHYQFRKVWPFTHIGLAFMGLAWGALLWGEGSGFFKCLGFLGLTHLLFFKKNAREYVYSPQFFVLGWSQIGLMLVALVFGSGVAVFGTVFVGPYFFVGAMLTLLEGRGNG